MSIQVEDISSTKKRLKIMVPQEVVSSELDAAFREVNQNAKVPGFRAGRVPKKVLEKRFGRDIRAQVLEKLVPDYYGRAMKEADLFPLGYPEFENKLEIETGKALDMTLTIEVRPKIENLKYEGLELTEISTDPEEEEVEKALKAIRKERGTLEPSEQAEDGGVAIVDYEAREGDTLLEDVSDTDFQFELGSDHLPEEFTANTVGKKPGEAYEFTVVYPEDHPGRSVAGKTVKFNVTLKEAKKRVLPELDDAFAKESGFENFEELRKRVAENIRGMKAQRAFVDHKAQASERLLSGHDFELPESLLQAELENCVEEARRKLEEGENKTDEELRKLVREDAERNIKGRMLVELIGEKEKVTVGEDDLRAKLAEISTTSGVHPEALVQYYSQNQDAVEQLRSTIFENKTFEKIISKAKFVKETS